MDRVNRLGTHVGASAKPFIRQFVMITPHLEQTSREVERLLKVDVAYKDPNIGCACSSALAAHSAASRELERNAQTFTWSTICT